MQNRKIARRGETRLNETAEKPRRFRRLRWVLLGMLLLCVALRIALPSVIEWALENPVAQNLQRKITVGNVDLGLLRGKFQLEDFRLEAPAEAAQPEDASLIQFERLQLELDWWPLWSRRVRLRSIDWQHPQLSLVRRADGQLDLPEPEAEETAEQEEDGEPWQVELAAITLKNPQVSLYEGNRNTEAVIDFSLQLFGLADFQLAAPALNFGGIQLSQPKLRVDREWLMGLQGEASDEVEPAVQAQAEPSSEQAVLIIHELKIDEAGLDWVFGEEALRIGFGFSSSNISLAAEQSFPLALWVEVAQGRLELAGDAQITPPGFKGELEWEGLVIPELLHAMGTELPLVVSKTKTAGVLAIDASFHESNKQVSLAGNIAFDDVALAMQEPKLAVQVAKLGGTELRINWDDQGGTQIKGAAKVEGRSYRHGR